jgi:signal transduction histidine kinase/Flp pilus assembly protein TadD
MKKKLLFAASLFMLTFTAISQSNVDSLLMLCEKAPEVQKIDLYLQLSYNTRSDTAASNTYSRKAYQLAAKNNQVPLQAKALYYLGETLFNASEYHSAISAYKKALSVYTSVNDSINLVNCHKLIGLCYYNMDQGDKAIVNFIEGMKLCENDTRVTAKLLSNIAMTHARMRNMKDAINYYRKALSLNASIRNLEGMGVNYNGLGEVYKIINRPDSALLNYKKAKNLNKKTEFQAVTLSNIAGIYMNYPDSLNKAIESLKESWAIFRKLGMYQYEAEFKQGLGVILYKLGKYKPAIAALKSSIELNDKFNRGFKIKTTCHHLLSKVYEKTGDYQTALKHMKLYMQYADSMAQNEKYERMSNLEKQYETEKKENEIIKLNAKQELANIQLSKDKQIKQLGFITLALLLVFVVYILVKYFEKMRSNALLEEKNIRIEQSERELQLLNASKNKFFSIIAHDLKNPFHNVMGFSSLLSKEYDHFTEKERRKFASDIYQSTNNIFRLLQNLLEWSRSQTGKLNYSPAVVEYQRILDNALSVLNSMATQKNIAIKTGNDPELKLFADPLMIETVLRNLINNAIKFTPEGGNIEVLAKKTDGQVQISVSDTGVGIAEEDTPNLFRIDSKVKRKGTNNEDGSGLGLILCHEFIIKHNGKIWVESSPGKGSEFIFSIPA